MIIKSLLEAIGNGESIKIAIGIDKCTFTV